MQTLGFYDEERLQKEIDNLILKCRSSDIFLMKTHYRLPKELDDIVAQGGALEIYTIRNLRDIATSMRRVWKLEDGVIRSNIRDHCEISKEKSSSSGVVVVRFERLFECEFSNVLARTAAYLEVPFKATFAESVGNQIKNYANMSGVSPALKIKKRWFRSVIWVNSRIRMGRFLKIILPRNIVQSLKETILLIDKKTMLHPDHISDGKILREDVEWGNLVSREFQDWQREFHYD